MSYLPPLIGFDEALLQLRIATTQTDLYADVAMKIEHASGFMYSWMKLTEIPDAWIVANTSPALLKVPFKVKALTLYFLSELYEHREASAFDLPETLKAWMRDLRDPTVA